MERIQQIKRKCLPGGIKVTWEFSIGPMVRTWCFHCCGPCTIPGQDWTRSSHKVHNVAKKHPKSNQFSSVALLCSTLCNSMDYSMPGLSVHHQLPEFAQTHVHRVSDAIQSSHPLSSPSPPPSIFRSIRSFLVNQFFTSGGQSNGVLASASVLPMNIQDGFPLGWTGWILLFKGLLRVFSNTTVQKHQFFGTQLSLYSNPYIHTWLLEKP